MAVGDGVCLGAWCAEQFPDLTLPLTYRRSPPRGLSQSRRVSRQVAGSIPEEDVAAQPQCPKP